MKIAIVTVAANLAWLGLPAEAQPVEDQRQQVRQVIVYGNDPCPRGTGDEIVVCARRPDSERYRLPPETQPPNPADTRSQLKRQQGIRETTDIGIGSCSAVGPGGHTGCLQEQINRSRVGMDGEDETPPDEPNL